MIYIYSLPATENPKAAPHAQEAVTALGPNHLSAPSTTSSQNPAPAPFQNYFSIHQLQATAQTIPQRLVHLPSSSRALHVPPRQRSALEGSPTLLSLDFELGTLWPHRAAVFLKEPKVFLRLRAQERIHPSILGALPSPLWEGSSEGLGAK